MEMEFGHMTSGSDDTIHINFTSSDRNVKLNTFILILKLEKQETRPNCERS